MTTERP